MIIKSIGDLLIGQSLVSVSPQQTVTETCHVMDAHNIGAVAVILDGTLVGILSERDVIRRCIVAGLDPAATRVNVVMTHKPIVIEHGESLAIAQSRMMDGGFRHLPVVDREGAPVGMLSMRDIPTEYRLMVERYQGYNGPAYA
jgi:CBS domain-containing protein